jgi:DNA-binding NarL/FixJ family response regulator
MPPESRSQIIRIGLVADEPIRMTGLASVFEEPPEEGKPQFIPVKGTATELLAGDVPDYIMVDLHAAPGIETLETIHRARPDIRLIVIGPQDDDELVINSIIAGARAYLDLTAAPEVVRSAVQVVTSGSIWAPRRLLSKLIDRLLRTPEGRYDKSVPNLTVRERQVLELILLARSNREIAEQLGIEERTVKAYVGRLMRKAGADNRIKLSLSALGQSLSSREDAGKKGGRED